MAYNADGAWITQDGVGMPLSSGGIQSLTPSQIATPQQLQAYLQSNPGANANDVASLGYQPIDGSSPGATLPILQKWNPGGQVVNVGGKQYYKVNPAGGWHDTELSGTGSGFGDFLKSPVGMGFLAAAGGGALGAFGEGAGIASGPLGYANGTIAGDAFMPGALFGGGEGVGGGAAISGTGAGMDFNFSDFFNLPGSEVTDPSLMYNTSGPSIDYSQNGGYGDAGNYGDPYNWQNPGTPDMGTGLPGSNISNYLSKLTNFLPKNADGSTNYGALAKLLGPIAGGILGGRGANGTPAGQTTTVTDIPDWQKPYALQSFNNAGGALQASQNAGSPLLSPATAEMAKTINGDYLSPGSNPYLDSTFQRGANVVGANIDSRFEGSGSQMNGVSRFGSGAHMDLLNRGLNDLATQIYGGNYQQERARQANAAINAPQFSTNSTNAMFAGPNNYSNIIRQNVGSATSTPYFTNTAGGILSGALAGGALSGVFK